VSDFNWLESENDFHTTIDSWWIAAFDNPVKTGRVSEEWASELKNYLTNKHIKADQTSTELSDDEWAEKVRIECEAIRRGKNGT